MQSRLHYRSIVTRSHLFRRITSRRRRRLLAERLEDRHLLAALTVNSSLDDIIPGDGLVTLREAIIAANDDSTTDLNQTGSGADTITFDSGLLGDSIDIGSQLPTITDDLMITGLGANLLAIDAGDGSNGTFGDGDGWRIFRIDDDNSGNQIDVTVSDVTLTGGDLNSPSAVLGGGAILNFEQLTLVRTALTDNASNVRAGALDNKDTGTVIIDSSTIAGNDAVTLGGGGILNEGTLTIRSSTVSNNTAALDGGGLSNDDAATLMMDNSTFAENVVGGLGTGVRIGTSNPTINNTIIEGSVAGSGTIGGSNNLINGSFGLAALADNGGPTSTHALQMGSPAIDAGGSSTPAFDQRGVPFQRSFGAGVDIGAYERQTRAASSFIVTTLADELNYSNNTATNGVSLREAINSANGSVGSNTITFDPLLTSTAAGMITLALGQLRIGSDVTIIGPGAERLAIDAIGKSRIIVFTAATGDLNIESLTLRNGRSVVGGGGILTYTGAVTLTNSTLSGNSTTGSSAEGGGIFTYSGAVTLMGSTLSGNSTMGSYANGGGIYSYSGDLVLTDSIITGNSTTGSSADGGGIYSNYGAVTLTNSTVSGNTTIGPTADGGGIYSIAGDVMLTGSTVGGNSTAGSEAVGGGIYSYSGNLTLTDSIVSGNSTTGTSADGGGIYSDFGDVTFMNSSLIGNTTMGPTADGGGIYANYGDVMLTGSTVSGNRAMGSNADGGAIYSDSGAVTLTSSTLTGNSSGDDGGGIYTDSGPVTLIDSTVSGNSAIGSTADGGGIFTSTGAVAINTSTVSGNSSGDGGGGIYSSYGTVTLNSSTVSGNTSGGDGGGIYTDDSTVLIENSTITANIAAEIGGGISLFADNYTVDERLTVRNSIVAGNSDNGTAPDLLAPGDIANDLAVDFSLIGNTTGSGIDGSTGTGNILNQSPDLDLLADNGGPTETHALLPGSPALDAGDDSVTETTDQRGAPFGRNDGGGVDIGAYEFFGNAPQVQSIVIDDGTQPSVVRSITVNFDSTIIFDAGAFDLKDDQNNPVDVTTNVAPGTPTNQVVLTFNGAGADPSGSLLDADYTLKVLDTKVRSAAAGVYLDGNNNGSMGGDAVDEFYRLFGDGDGDGITGFLDFNFFFLPAFAKSQGQPGYLASMDFDGDGIVGFLDFNFGFLANFGKVR